jgi:hypothetical protein
MNQPLPVWLAVVGPVATLLGTMLVVMLGVYLQNRALERAVDLVRSEIREHIAELKLEVLTHISKLDHRVERLEESRGLIRTP